MKKLQPYAKSGLDWQAVLRAASAGGVDLSVEVEGQHLSGGEYYIYTAGATEVELDVLTVRQRYSFCDDAVFILE